ncbi:MAG TPA: hypothetical protein VFV53_04690 [Candidatus Limnocylindrales bacterium]|nr:hypothetical protein [Candidatus Limnocylindrales bacterium]
MTASISGTDRSRLATVLLATALLVAACGGSGSSIELATPTLRPTPTPTPLDVGQAFLDRVSEPGFTAKITLSGTMEMGVSATVTGTISGSGEDSRTLIELDFGDTSIETETITVDGTTYSRTEPGPWLEATTSSAGLPPAPPSASGVPAADDVTLTAWLRRLQTIRDLGVETRNGERLHHLSVGREPVPPAVIGFDSPMFIDPSLTIDFYARDDGTPAVFAVEGSWRQIVGAEEVTVDLAMDMTLSMIGIPIAIKAPRDVWVTYESPLGYSMSHPEDVTVESRDGYDVYLQDKFDGYELIYVDSWPEAAGLSTGGFRDALLEYVGDSWGDPTMTPVAYSLAGEPAYFARFKYAYDDGSPATVIDVMAMHEDIGWEITLNTDPSWETIDTNLLKRFLATFAFAE